MALPLLPAEVIASAEHQEEAEDGEKDDTVSRHHQATGSPFDLFKNKRWVGESVQWMSHVSHLFFIYLFIMKQSSQEL